MVKYSRKALFEYCHQIQTTDFVSENSTFGKGSIRNLLVHIANCYEFWVIKQGMGKDIHFTSYSSQHTIEDIQKLYQETDAYMEEFIQNAVWDKPLTIITSDKTVIATPLKLFTHTITHEFHHKGQILSLSRHLGYSPIDTDVIR
jgi:uncharacterized damage-inducible protein DinB